MSPKKNQSAPKANSAISNDVLTQIRSGQVHMQPGWYFGLLSTGFALALAGGLLLASYFLNVMFVHWQISSDDAAPWLNGRLYANAYHVPWFVLLMTIAAIVGVGYLLKKRPVYGQKLPVWSAMLGAALFIVVLSFGINHSSLNHNLRKAQPFGPLYPRIHRPLPPGVQLEYRTEVIHINSRSI